MVTIVPLSLPFPGFSVGEMYFFPSLMLGLAICLALVNGDMVK